jgi:DNA-binding Xre family transcriptional regulator
MTQDPYTQKEKLLRRKHRLEWETLAAKREAESSRRSPSDFSGQVTFRLGPDPFEVEAAELKARQHEELLALVNERIAANSPPDLSPPTKRFTGTVTSPLAARKAEEFIRKKGIGFTAFAVMVGTTDRTLRRFRKTGSVRRDIFHKVVEVLGVKPEDLLS